MGGGQSLETNVMGEATVHRAKLGFGGKPVKGGFSAGPKTMEKIRTRSDFCLLKIVEMDIVRQAFSLWAKDEGAVYLEFITDVNDMKITVNRMEQTMKVISIFSKYVPAKSAKKKLNIDSATRSTIMLAFENEVYDASVFDLAYEKAYQCLKFDYMPLFLISDDFTKLEERTKVRRGSSNKMIDLKAILSETRCALALTTFLQKFTDPVMLSYARLWESVSDFKSNYANMAAADQTKAAKKVWKHVVKEVSLPIHLRIATYEKVNGNGNPGFRPGQETFDEVQDFMCDMLQAGCQRPFLVSSEYTDFLASASEEYKLDSAVLTLGEFTDDRQLMNTKEEYELDLNIALKLENVLDDPLLCAYFRRFLRLSFQEENFLFFRDVQDMKIQHYVKSTSSEIQPDMSLKEIMEVSTEKIFEKFIKVGAMFEINLSNDVRENIVEHVNNGATGREDIYDDAQKEIFKQMKVGGFMQFKKHDLFKHFVKAHKQKFMQRTFVIGDKKKVQKLTLDHHVRKESGLNFEESADRDFDLDAHIKSKKG